ncbi:MAG: SBBP repeat-containing protein, partial [Candidatus Hermodarchaeota archaeon]
MKNENARKKKCINWASPKFVLKRQLMYWGMIISVFILIGSLFLSLFPHNVEGASSQIESETIFENGLAEDRTPINAELPINFEIEGIKDKNINKDIKIPFSGFIKNQGQLNEENIQYYYSTEDITLGFSPSSILFISHSHKQLTFSLSFPGSQAVNPTGIAESTNKVNYFYGVHQFIDIPTYNEVWYYDLYSGIDLRYYMTDQGLKYDFLVHPGANPNQINIKVSQSMSLNIKNQIVSYWSDASNSPLLQDKNLHVFQSDGIDVSAHFVPRKNIANTYGFQISSFDSTQVLTIDPLLLSFSTFFGGSGDDAALDIAVDSEGNAIIVGTTNATIPIFNAFQTNAGGAIDVFVAKLNATGNGLIFSTYLGGSADDEGRGIAIDDSGNSYIIGFTESSDFPVTPNAYNSTYGGGEEVFVTKLNATGNGLIFSTFLGGNADEWGFKIALDSQGNSYVIGTTYSSDFPITIPSYQSTLRGYSDAFITKLNATGTGLVFSTFLGGNDYDLGRDIAVDNSENCYLLGMTFSTDFPIENGYQNTHDGVSFDLFVTKLNATGTGLIYSTYLGGNEDEFGRGLALDSGGNVYLTGETWSENYPTTANAYQNTSIDEGVGISFIQDAFVTKLNSTGNGLIFSTF